MTTKKMGNLCLVLLTLLEMGACLLYFLVYFLEYYVCVDEDDFAHIEEVVLVLSLTASLTGLSSFVYTLTVLVDALQSARSYLAFAQRQSNPYRRSLICYYVLTILFNLTQALVFFIVAVLFLAIYLCHIQSFTWTSLCTLNPHFMFSGAGYYLNVFLLIISFLCVPCIIVRLAPLVK